MDERLERHLCNLHNEVFEAAESRINTECSLTIREGISGYLLTTDAGRHPHKKPPMGSRLASLLLSVRACGSSQGESRQDVIFWQKSADLRSESVSKSPG